MYTLRRGEEENITVELLKDIIEYSQALNPRFENLDNYYIGKQDILSRDKADTQANNKVVVNHAKYIIDISTGYLLGAPVSYVADGNLGIEHIEEAFKRQTISNLDSELAKDAGIFGVQYEYLYANENSEPCSAKLDPRNTVIVRDTTVEHKKLFAIIYQENKVKGRSKSTDFDITYVDDSVVREYRVKGKQLTQIGADKPHAFGVVPVIEYRNNAEYLGTFEPVLSLIDAYNVLQSDRVNDREQLVDAILKAKNFKLTPEQLTDLKSNRLVSGIPQDADLEYLVKDVDEQDADVLRQTLESDIFKIAMVPNMTDENFAQNDSGVAIRYKLLPFEQSTQDRERYFEMGLMERFVAYSNFLATSGKSTKQIPIEKVDVVFRRNLPSNDLEISEMINNLDGIVDQELLVSQLSFVQNAGDTVKKAQLEREAAGNFGTDAATDSNQNSADEE